MKVVAITAMALFASATAALAQAPMAHSNMSGMDHSTGPELIEPGQSAFAAIQEVVKRLEGDPNTDWSRVNIERLRQHLIDMDEVTLHAAIQERQIPNGMRYTVTGEGRTRDAIQHMVIGHANTMGDAEHWTMSADQTNRGAVVTVMAKQTTDLPEIRALGLLGMMAEGAHHQTHHWYLATGDGPMAHTTVDAHVAP